MSLQNVYKKMQLTNLNIPQPNLIRLIELQEDVNSIARHDLGNSIGGIRANIKDLQMYLEQNQELSKEFMEYITKSISKIRILSERSLTNVNILFPFQQTRTQIFISKPINIYKEICSMWQDKKISLDKKSPRTLEIVYPENILGIIINEIITNSIKHNSPDCKIMVSWFIANDSFKCEIHDDGKGIIPGLGKTVLSAGTILGSLKYDYDRPNGLSIINKLIVKSGGSLNFTKSKRLGGTLTFFNIPVFAYYQKGQTYEKTR